MSVATLDGITAATITTDRLATRVLTTGPDDGVPVLFLHGNLSSATWWEEAMLRLPAGFPGDCPGPAWLWRGRSRRQGRRHPGHE